MVIAEMHRRKGRRRVTHSLHPTRARAAPPGTDSFLGSHTDQTAPLVHSAARTWQCSTTPTKPPSYAVGAIPPSAFGASQRSSESTGRHHVAGNKFWGRSWVREPPRRRSNAHSGRAAASDFR
jgi:hypothetical protein